MSAPRLIVPPGGGGGISGSGTPGKLAKFTGATALGDSLLSESGTTITSAATAETFGGAQTWTFGAPNSQALVVLSNAGAERTLVLDTISRAVGIGGAPGTLLHVQDAAGYPFAGSTYAGVRLQRSTEALFSASDYTRSFRAGLTGSTAVVGTSTAHDLLLQRGNVTALTLGASGAVAFAGNLTSSAAQTWTLASSTTALNIQSGLLNLDTTNSRVGIGTASPIGTLDVRAANPTIICSNSSVRYGYSVWNDAASEFRTGTGGAHAFTLLTANTERMRIDAAGNVGIGTTAPSGPLSVTPPQYSTGTASQSLFVVTGVGTTFTLSMVGSQFVFANGVSAGTITAFTDATTITVSVSQTVTSQAYKISYTGLQVSTGGSVGIGMTSPLSGHSLSVNGKIGGSLFTGSYVEFPVSGNTSLRANYTVNIGYADTLNVTNGGLVGIGTASPTALLEVKGSSGNLLALTNGGVNKLTVTSAGSCSAAADFTASSGFGAGGWATFWGSSSGGVGLGSGNLIGWDAATTHPGYSVTGYDTTLSRNAAGVLQVGTGTTGNALGTLAAAGVKLPATPGNTDAQTLDCYQENPLATTAGNGWTPTLSAAATWGGTQPNVTYARYVRMGSMVFCEVTLAMGAGTMTSTYPLTTITSPFTTNANANYSAVPVAAAGASGVGFQTGTTVYLPTIGASSTFILAWSFFA